MNKRDWQADKELPDYGGMLMRVAKANDRAAAEKERADKAEEYIKVLERAGHKQKYDLLDAEAREQKLKEAMENIKRDIPYSDTPAKDAIKLANDALASLYPDTKEESK